MSKRFHFYTLVLRINKDTKLLRAINNQKHFHFKERADRIFIVK